MDRSIALTVETINQPFVCLKFGELFTERKNVNAFNVVFIQLKPTVAGHVHLRIKSISSLHFSSFLNCSTDFTYTSDSFIAFLLSVLQSNLLYVYSIYIFFLSLSFRKAPGLQTLIFILFCFLSYFLSIIRRVWSEVLYASLQTDVILQAYSIGKSRLRF